MSEVLRALDGAGSICAVQVCYEVIRVTFSSEAALLQAKSREGVNLFSRWFTILGGGPPPTTVHVFDYPYEKPDAAIECHLKDFGSVWWIRKQTYVSRQDVYNGTCMVSMALAEPQSLPQFLKVGSYWCRLWYRGRPLICNSCE